MKWRQGTIGNINAFNFTDHPRSTLWWRRLLIWSFLKNFQIVSGGWEFSFFYGGWEFSIFLWQVGIFNSFMGGNFQSVSGGWEALISDISDIKPLVLKIIIISM